MPSEQTPSVGRVVHVYLRRGGKAIGPLVGLVHAVDDGAGVAFDTVDLIVFQPNSLQKWSQLDVWLCRDVKHRDDAGTDDEYWIWPPRV